MIRIQPNAPNRDASISLAISPFKHSLKRLWGWQNVFPFPAPGRMRMGGFGRILKRR